MRKETVYNKIVNIAEDGEITILSEIFEYTETLEFSNGEKETKVTMKGATGDKFYPITEADIQDRIGEYENNDLEFLKYWADNIGDLSSQVIDDIDTSREALIDFFYDQSAPELWDYMRQELGKTDPEAEDYPVLFECVGGGRCFSKDFQGNRNVKLSKLIQKAES